MKTLPRGAFADIISLENLRRAAARARRGKSRKPNVEAFFLHFESELLALRRELVDGTYHPGGYRFFEIREPKRRLIAAAPFRDRVVHHALCNLMQPVLERRFVDRSFSCQIGKGTTAARECCRRLTNRYRYVLKCDVRKFFPNVDHAILLEKLERLVRCTQTLELCRRIITSYRTGADVPTPLFPGDDFIEAIARPRGLPIGNLTSQLWGNFLLDDLDHRLAEEAHHGSFVRYTDDLLIFSDKKTRLWDLRSLVIAELHSLRLTLAEPKSRLMATREGIPFCGFRFFPGLRPRVLGATKRRFERRRDRLLNKRAMRQVSQMVFAWYQFSREGNSYGLRRAYTRRPIEI